VKRIHVIAPSGASLDESSPAAGIDWLNSQGITVKNTECLKRVHQRFSGTDTQRLAELNAIAQLPPEDFVMAMRGGYGLHRLLPDVEWDAIAGAVEQGLQICGHSDFTAFHLGLLAKTGAISLSGPMLNYDFGHQAMEGEASNPNRNEFMWKHFINAARERTLACSVSSPQSYLGEKTSGEISGILWGGNLTVLTSMIGTPFFPNHEQTQGGILFLEDVNEHPYRIERMLIQLTDSGVLANQAAILLGGFSAYRLFENDRGYDLKSAIKAIRARLPGNIPLLTDLPFGHQANKITLPVGAQAGLTYDTAGFQLKASW